MLWQPLDLAQVCPAHTQITACSYFGYVYLSLLVKLYGDSKDRRIQEKLGYNEDDYVYSDGVIGNLYDRERTNYFKNRIHDKIDYREDDGDEVVRNLYYRDRTDSVFKDGRTQEELGNQEDGYTDGAAVKNLYDRDRTDSVFKDRRIREKLAKQEDDYRDGAVRNLYDRDRTDSVFQDRRIREELGKQEDAYSDEVVRNLYDHGTTDSYKEDYDFIVVGAGAAGCVVANRLSAIDHWKVLLLEAGGEQPDVTLVPGLSTALIGSSIDWNYSTQPDDKSCLARPSQRCGWPRGKTMGGSSSINSMSYIRGNMADFDGWAALGNHGWSYEDVLPFFKKSEHNLGYEASNRKYHGVDGEQFVSRYPYIDGPSFMMTDAFHEAGLPFVDYNGAQQEGTMQAQAFVKNGERVSTNNGFIQPIRYKRKNLTVKPNSEVVKILIDDHNRAYGVKYILNGKVHTALATKEVIVSGGSINSPKLLMLSGIGPKEHLLNLHIDVVQDLAVGENLHDHPTFNGYVIALPNKTATSVSQREILKQVHRAKFAEYEKGPLWGNGAVNSISFIRTDPHLSAPDVQFQMDVANWQEFIREPTVVDSIAILPTSFYNGVLPRTMNLVPKSRGKILLNATDPYGPPLIYANYFGDPRDFIPILRGVRFLLSLENTHAFKSRGAHFVKTPLKACRHLEWGSDEYTICLAQAYTSSTYHPVGTCKMGPHTDRQAVVDPRLRVYGIQRLRVIDSSIMPVVTRGNTNAASIMIGEKGAAHIIEEWCKH